MKIHALIATVLVLGFAPPAFAHAFLQHASPGAGDTLAGAPKEIALSFTEQLEPSFSGVTVTDADGHDVEASSALVSGPSVTVTLKPLAPGSYHVTWHAVSLDTHRTDGAYSFTVKP
jgi:methionine-rich copper-binding protein CopC